LISPKANNGLLQPQLQDDDDDDEERRSVPELGSMVLLFLASFHTFLSSSFFFSFISIPRFLLSFPSAYLQLGSAPIWPTAGPVG